MHIQVKQKQKLIDINGPIFNLIIININNKTAQYKRSICWQYMVGHGLLTRNPNSSLTSLQPKNVYA